MESKRGVVIGIEGLIGAGKTEFSKSLQECLGDECVLFLEPDEKEGKNPYLAKYYEDPARWSFTMQVHLLAMRFRAHKEAQWYVMNKQKPAILDRSFQGDTAFARLQYRMGLVSEEEFETYRKIYHAMTASVLLPNIFVHLQVDPHTSIKRISKRMTEQSGRVCEADIDLQYLIDLDEEINTMIDILEKQGVFVIRQDWNEDQEINSSNPHIQRIAKEIKTHTVPDLFLDIHRRSI